MRNLLGFIVKNNFGLIFIILEIFTFILLIQNNDYHQSRYLNFVQRLDASFHQYTFRLKKFEHLEEENERLVNENIKLRHQLSNWYFQVTTTPSIILDTNAFNQYRFIPAKVINNSTNKQYNYITLNKGQKDGIEPEMAVISPDGVVGKVVRVSTNFSVVISLLNRELFSISSKIKGSDYFGPVTWEGDNYRTAYMTDIPFHVVPKTGDTIITSGLSHEFPENIPVGYVEDYTQLGNNLKLTIHLVTDFKKLTNVYVIKNLYKNEVEKLEKLE